MANASSVVNRMLVGLVALVLVLGTAVVGLVGCSQSGESLYQSKCSTCHALSVVENSTYVTSGSWDSIVKDMQSRSTTISDSDATAITSYLSETYPGK